MLDPGCRLGTGQLSPLGINEQGGSNPLTLAPFGTSALTIVAPDAAVPTFVTVMMKLISPPGGTKSGPPSSATTRSACNPVTVGVGDPIGVTETTAVGVAVISAGTVAVAAGVNASVGVATGRVAVSAGRVAVGSPTVA